jgi:hypothetical protein
VDQPFAEAAPVTSQSVLIYLEGDARGCWIPLYDIYKEMALLACKGETLCKNSQESYIKKGFKDSKSYHDNHRMNTYPTVPLKPISIRWDFSFNKIDLYKKNLGD